MPITAKLSRRFYEALGDDVANELVDWFNAVDLTYRSDLERVNELNWARFEAKLNEGLAGLRAEFKQDLAILRSEVKGDLAALRNDLTRELAADRVAVEALGSQLRIEMAVLRADLIKWMFLFWLGTVAAGVATRLL